MSPSDNDPKSEQKTSKSDPAREDTRPDMSAVPEDPVEASATKEKAVEPKVEPPPDYREIRIQTLERALADREATLHSYIRAHKKATEEFDAYKARLERDRERELVASKAQFVEKLLDLDDNLLRTITAARTGAGGNVEAFVQGLELVHRQFVDRLGELGLERVDPLGKPFDPAHMEALGMLPVDDPAKNDTVVATLRTGYRIGEREIRPALVQVGRFYS